jgi:predicted molibdopterin-dependent oxidoreductase YjgC
MIGCRVLPLREKANAQGLLDMGANPSWLPGYRSAASPDALAGIAREWGAALDGLVPAVPDLAWQLTGGGIKAAVVLGEDPLGCPTLPESLRSALASVQLLIAADVLSTSTTDAARVVLPMCGSTETSGTFTNAERRVQAVRQVVAPASGLENWEMLCSLAREMGSGSAFQYSSVDDVFDEIRRVAPIYADVDVDSEGPEGIWNGDIFPLPSMPAVAASSPVGLPVHTASLDNLDARFSRWFSATLAKPKS